MKFKQVPVQQSFGSERRAPPSGEIMGLLKLEDYMPAALADSLKADEEDRKNGHTTPVQVKEE